MEFAYSVMPFGIASVIIYCQPFIDEHFNRVDFILCQDHFILVTVILDLCSVSIIFTLVEVMTKF